MEEGTITGWFGGITLTLSNHYESISPDLDAVMQEDIRRRREDENARKNAAMLAEGRND